ncbi:MAG: metalloregulator ArsR/SmtB family transcription factor [Mycobacteriales bacterium]
MTVFEALADPIRRQIIELLGPSPMTAGDIAARFDVSRPAVSRHLRVLREAGLVRVEGAAQHRVYSLECEPLHELEEWIERAARNG